MNTPVNDGGPAFPQTPILNQNNEVVTSGMYFAEGPGMSIRDWLAGQALAGVASMPAFHSFIVEKQIKRPGREAATVGECVAYYCYDLADAMIRARNTQPTE
jgi:hypothetical protein